MDDRNQSFVIASGGNPLFQLLVDESCAVFIWLTDEFLRYAHSVLAKLFILDSIRHNSSDY
jgi:hypothetical protein